MDVAAGTEWRFGGTLADCNLPASFTTFFPTRVAANQQIANMAVKPHEIAWAKCIAIPNLQRRLPAWSRVPAESHSFSIRTRPIMKRVGFSTRHATRINTPSPTQTSEQDARYNPELGRAKRQRSVSYTPAEQDHQLSGDSVPEADIVSLDMQSKVDVANDIMAQPTTSSTDAFKQCRSGHYVRACRTKRRLNVDFYPDQGGLKGGNRLETYQMLSPILKQAAEFGLKKIDATSVSIAQTVATTRTVRRKPHRKSTRVVAELSAIADVTEPESSLALMKPPQLMAEAKSPLKRVAKLTSPVKASSNRLAETKITLLPASSPGAEPSPTKSTSTPSTPLKEALSPHSISLMHSLFGSSIQTESMHGDAEQHSPLAPNRPTHVFKAPSYTDSSSSSLKIVEDSTQTPGPATYDRPVAPTPSKWNRAEPTTPFQTVTPLPAGQSPFGLTPAAHAETPQPLETAFKAVDSVNKFDFGSTTPDFNAINSARWMTESAKPVESQRMRNVKNRRRRSESFIQTFLRNNALRQSSSPDKAPARKSRQSMHAHAAGPGRHAMKSPVNPAVVMTASTPTIRVQFADDAAPATPTEARATNSRDIFNIDVRQNPDIFGSQISSLARIAESRCDGHAKVMVMVKEENGRLVVRFKLPAEYAHMFPESQGADESHFTTSPSQISLSPRISFKGHQMPMQSSPLANSLIPSSAFSTPSGNQDRTLAIPEFAPSPVAARQAQNSPVKHRPHELSPVMEQNLDEMEEDDASIISCPSAIAENLDTTIPGLNITYHEPAEQSPQSWSQVPTPRAEKAEMSSLTELGTTPSITGLGITGASPGMTFDTPANEAFSTPINPSMILAQPFPVVSTPTPAPKEISGADAYELASITVQAVEPEQATPREKTTSSAPENRTPTATPTLTTSFTPVNRPSSRNGGSAGRPKQVEEKASDNFGAKLDDDSPGRAYMREFIKRSKPKRLSTTETGSPIANPGKRQPLGAKSPNTESPQKTKRKHEKHEADAESPLKKSAEPEAKRARTNVKEPRKAAPASKPRAAPAKRAKVVSKTAGNAEEQEDEEMRDGRVTRRSSRLQTHGIEPAPKSSIPTSIKLGKPGVLRRTSTPKPPGRNAHPDVTHQTRVNTLMNKKNAEKPSLVLARVLEAQEDEANGHDSEDSASSQTRVEWKTPLAVYQEKKEEDYPEEKAKKGKPGPKPKATYKSSGIAKPTKTKTAEQKRRAEQVAASFGMSKNGTPAKLQRVTRSRMRTKM